MPTLKTVTLGCKVNQYETEYVRQGLARLGYGEPIEGQAPDLCLVNTCSVTAESEAKGRKLIRKLAHDNPGMDIIVMGCYATRAPQEVAALPGIVEVVTDKRRLPDLLARLGVSDPPDGIAEFPSRRRAYVKIQDGCQMHCSFCIIPQVRSVLWTRPADEVVAEVRRLVDHGHREIVLTGIHLGHYGMGRNGDSSNLPGGPQAGTDAQRWTSHKLDRSPFHTPDIATGARIRLAGLLRQIAELPGEFRVRLSSLETSEATPELLSVMRDHPERFCPHLHVALQSGSDRVLARMRRPWSAGRFVDRCREIHEALDRPALTTDVIVGFPGETEEDFAATCRVVAEVGFSKVHVFRYSPRQGTPAADMPDQVLDRRKSQRAAELERLSRLLRQEFLKSLSGRPHRVLVESALSDRPGWMLGTCDRYAEFELPVAATARGQFCSVVAYEIAGDRLRAKPF